LERNTLADKLVQDRLRGDKTAKSMTTALSARPGQRRRCRSLLAVVLQEAAMVRAIVGFVKAAIVGSSKMLAPAEGYLLAVLVVALVQDLTSC